MHYVLLVFSNIQLLFFSQNTYLSYLFYALFQGHNSYLMLNPVSTYILNIWFINTFFRYTQLNDHTVLFLTIQLSTSTKLNGSKYCYVSLIIQLNITHLFTQLNDQIVLFQAIQFSISHLFALSLNAKQFYLIHRLDPFRCYQSGPEGVFYIPQSSSITGHLPSDSWVSYPRHSKRASYPFAEIQMLYSTVPACRAILKRK